MPHLCHAFFEASPRTSTAQVHRRFRLRGGAKRVSQGRGLAAVPARVRLGFVPSLLAMWALALVGSTGCVTTRDEGIAMRADIDTLMDNVAHIQRTTEDERATLAQKLAGMEARVVALEGTLSSLRQADADGGVRLEKIITELQTLRGEIEEARYQLGETKKSVQDILDRPPVTVAAAAEAPKVDAPQKPVIAGEEVPDDRQALYDFAKKLYDEQKYNESLEAFELFSSRQPDDELKDNVWFWSGEAHYQLAKAAEDSKEKGKAYKKAILSYQKVLEIPDSNKGDGALYKIGMAFEALGFTDEAKVFYEEILEKHPKSNLRSGAQKRLQDLKSQKKQKKPGRKG